MLGSGLFGQTNSMWGGVLMRLTRAFQMVIRWGPRPGGIPRVSDTPVTTISNRAAHIGKCTNPCFALYPIVAFLVVYFILYF